MFGDVPVCAVRPHLGHLRRPGRGGLPRLLPVLRQSAQGGAGLQEEAARATARGRQEGGAEQGPAAAGLCRPGGGAEVLPAGGEEGEGGSTSVCCWVTFNPVREQVQLGEELLAQGDIETGVEHLSLAVAVCGQPHSLLGVLQQTLPPQIYKLLLQNLDVAQDRVRSHVASNVPGLLGSSGGAGARPGPASAPGDGPPDRSSGGASASAPGSGPATMNEEDVE